MTSTLVSNFEADVIACYACRCLLADPMGVFAVNQRGFLTFVHSSLFTRLQTKSQGGSRSPIIWMSLSQALMTRWKLQASQGEAI